MRFIGINIIYPQINFQPSAINLKNDLVIHIRSGDIFCGEK